MLFYVLRRLGLLGDASKEPARRQHIVVSSYSDVQSALARAEFFEQEGVGRRPEGVIMVRVENSIKNLARGFRLTFEGSEAARLNAVQPAILSAPSEAFR